MVVTGLALLPVLEARVPRGHGVAVRLRVAFRDALVPIVALGLIAMLQNVDVIVVRHQVGEVAAGAYAAAAVAAKVVVWTAVGVALYVIPEAAGRTAAGRGARSVLLRATAVVGVVAAPALLVMTVAPKLVLRLGFGAEYEVAADALPLLGVAMSLLALTYLTVNFLLAIGQSRFLVPLAVVAIAEPILLLAGVVRQPDVVRDRGPDRAGGRCGRRARPDAAARAGGRAGAGVIVARGLVLVAAAVALWLLAGELTTARDVSRAEALIEGPRAREQVDQALVLLGRAARRTDDSTPLLRSGELQLFAGNYRAALSAAQAVTKREPENARAWLVTAQAAGELGDDTLEAAARRRIGVLVATP